MADPQASRRNNLPLQLTSFIGRERETAEVKRLLVHTRLLTLTGAGGCGKTRLALRCGGELLQEFKDGVWWVELADLSEPILVPQAVAAALGETEQQTRPLVETLKESIRTKSLLLLLDNCEHLLSACAEISDALLRAGPGLRIIATSREPLRVEGEVRWRVPSLSLPDAHRLPGVEQLRLYEAIRLFCERARAVLPTFALTKENAPSVALVCQRLDGIPLAIELAAARLNALTVEQIEARLHDRFQLLTKRGRTSLPRQQTLRATLDWSYDLLSEQDRILLLRLSVFAGGWTLEAAERVCAGEGLDEGDILDLLARLVDKSLVLFDERDGHGRYRLLESVRHYSNERLEESGKADDVRRQHTDWYLALAEQAERELHGRRQEMWLERLETEHENLHAALDWCLIDSRDAEAGVRLSGALVFFWRVRGHISEGSRWLEHALSQGSNVSIPARAKALVAAGLLFQIQGRYKRAIELAKESLALFQQLGDRRGIGLSLLRLGAVALFQGALEEANTLYTKSLTNFREAGDDWGIAIALNVLGEVARSRDDYKAARSHYNESLAILRAMGDKRSIAVGLHNLGYVALHQGDYENAKALLTESLDIGRKIGHKQVIAESLAGFAEVAIVEGRLEQAVRLLGAADVLLGTLGILFSPPDQAGYGRTVDATRKALGDTAFAAAWAEGRAMTLDQVIQFALTPTNEASRKETPAPQKAVAGKRAGLLAPREREVAVLIASGKTNREIASQLSITESTAETHVQHILNKLGFNSRAQIAAWVVAHGLTSSPADN